MWSWNSDFKSRFIIRYIDVLETQLWSPKWNSHRLKNFLWSKCYSSPLIITMQKMKCKSLNGFWMFVIVLCYTWKVCYFMSYSLYFKQIEQEFTNTPLTFPAWSTVMIRLLRQKIIFFFFFHQTVFFTCGGGGNPA